MNDDLSELAPANPSPELDQTGSVATVVAPDESITVTDDLATPKVQQVSLTGIWDRLGSAPIGGSSAGVVSFFVAAACSVFVFLLVNWPQPDGLGSLFKPLLFLDTTPSGGDMGAHVWGPAYLRDNLLTQGRLSGWTPDWYAGFPAYHFYMVVPSLAILALNMGLPYQIGLPLALVIIFGGFYTTGDLPKYKNAARIAAIIIALLIVGLPYGVSFKIISVSGLVLFPLSAWAMGRLARCAEPIPGFLALAAFVFLFDTNFSIYGGNFLSTLAGEFAFSISLCIALLTIGIVIRALDDRVWRTRAAVAVAMVPLCHLLPTFFLIPAILLAVILNDSISRKWFFATLVGFALPAAFAHSIGNRLAWLSDKPIDQVDVNPVVIVLGGVGALAVLSVSFAANSAIRDRANWLLTFGPVAVLLSAFWLVPFYLQRHYFNDMGWERLEDVGPPLLTVPIKVALPVAAIGLLLCYVTRERIGLIFTGTGLIFLISVVYLPEGKLWNARLLPFYYLSVYMVAAVGVALIVRFAAAAHAKNFQRPDTRTIHVGLGCALVAVFFAVSMPLRIVPFGSVADDGSYSVAFFKNTASSAIPSWVNWNYSGYEAKPSYGEYSSVVRAMDEVGQSQGCGRTMWEFNGDGQEKYGTPMALMLLPFWTDGCIGSMEGLYFESSATTPFHFMNQSTMSEAPSRAQRDLPYKAFDIENGVDQLQIMGVRYYMAQTDSAIAAATDHPDLRQIAEAQPFIVFQVAESDLVEGLESNPVVVAGPTEEQLAGREEVPTRFDLGWESQAVKFFGQPEGFQALPAEDGPESWDRFQVLEPTDGAALTPAVVSNIEVGNSNLSFDVDEIGSPVLVKVSYFPNWKVEGAEGPWRVGPNLMAVVPTSKTVSMSYGYTFVDIAGIVLTLLGFAGLWYFVNDRSRKIRHSETSGDIAAASSVIAEDRPSMSSQLAADEEVDDESPKVPEQDRELVEASGDDTAVPAMMGSDFERTLTLSKVAAAPKAESAVSGAGSSTATLDPIEADQTDDQLEVQRDESDEDGIAPTGLSSEPESLPQKGEALSEDI